MHGKSSLNNNNVIEEVVIELNSGNLEKSLYYRDEGNVSKKTMQQEEIL